MFKNNITQNYDLISALFFNDKLYTAGMYTPIAALKDKVPVALVNSSVPPHQLPSKNRQTNDDFSIGGEIYEIDSEKLAVAITTVYKKTSLNLDNFVKDYRINDKILPSVDIYLIYDNVIYAKDSTVSLQNLSIKEPAIGEILQSDYLQNADDNTKFTRILFGETTKKIDNTITLGKIFEYTQNHLVVINVYSYAPNFKPERRTQHEKRIINFCSLHMPDISCGLLFSAAASRIKCAPPNDYD